jgi:hypothetical protein
VSIFTRKIAQFLTSLPIKYETLLVRSNCQEFAAIWRKTYTVHKVQMFPVMQATNRSERSFTSGQLDPLLICHSIIGDSFVTIKKNGNP